MKLRDVFDGFFGFRFFSSIFVFMGCRFVGHLFALGQLFMGGV